MDTKSGCGRLDLSAFQNGAFHPAAQAIRHGATPVETRTWRPNETELPDPGPFFEPRPS